MRSLSQRALLILALALMAAGLVLGGAGRVAEMSLVGSNQENSQGIGPEDGQADGQSGRPGEGRMGPMRPGDPRQHGFGARRLPPGQLPGQPLAPGSRARPITPPSTSPRP